MHHLVFVAAIGLYIISLAAALLLMLFKKNISAQSTQKIVYTQFAILILAYVLCTMRGTIVSTSFSQMLSIISFCFGVAICGVALRSTLHVMWKGYFAIFALSFVLFVTNSSALVGFITNYSFFTNAANKFALGDHYYVELQTSMLSNEELLPRYKLYKRIFYFNKTMVRDIDFGFKPDSIAMPAITDSVATLRAYNKWHSDTVVTVRLTTIGRKKNIEQRRSGGK